MIEIRTVHEQLLDLCQRELAEGKWAVGARFPSERELAATHGISRATANKVLAKLASEGWLEQRRGLGAFVAEKPTLFASLRRMESFTEFAAAQGFQPKTKVLRFERGANPPAFVRDADVSPDWIYLERLRLADGEAVIFERRWLPAARYPRLRARSVAGSFYELCRERYGWHAARQDASLRAVLPPDLGQDTWKVPALRLRGTAHDETGELLWIQELFYRGDRFDLHHQAESAVGVPELGLRLT